jgi:hypothetical protein
MAYASRRVTDTWSWRELPVLEAVLRLGRLERLATPEAIADEAIMHVGDVADGIARLVEMRFVDTLELASNGSVVRVVEPTAALRGLLQPLARTVEQPSALPSVSGAALDPPADAS